MAKSRVRDKRLDVWALTIEGRNVEVEVRMAARSRSSLIHDPGSTYFYAVLPDDLGRIEDTDIKALRKKTEERLKKDYAADWKLVMQILVGRVGVSYCDCTAGMSFGVQFYAIAETPEGTINRRVTERAVESGDWKTARETVWKGEPRRQEGLGQVSSIVPATKANIAAAEEFTSRLKALHDEVCRRFSPDLVQETLHALPRLLADGSDSE